MRMRLAIVMGCFALLGWAALAHAGQTTPAILALGNAGFLNPAGVEQATGTPLSQDPHTPLNDVPLLILANISFPSLPQPIQDGLVAYIEGGGTLLITGGAQSFGSGGYKAVAALIPFQIRSDNDWRAISFRPPVPLQPGHPILAGVSFITVGAVNDMNPRPDAAEILQSAGGGRAGIGAGGTGGGSFLYPLVAEVRVGAGRVIGIAFDLNEFAGMRDRDLFVRNTLTYLVAASKVGTPR
jgi:hypothetical protein